MLSPKKIRLVHGDITRAEVDAVVNAANPVMLGGGGVDGAIHYAAGPRLREACRRIEAVNGVRCPPGEARITPGFNLRAKWVIHAVGPRYRLDPEPERLLRSAYAASLRLALDNDCRTIAFPAISCGAYGYPVEEAAAIALDVCSEQQWQGLAISFYLFSEHMLAVWQQALRQMEQRQETR
ncbi:O-acetyl-ADP-ribose deacetylase [Thermodesulfobacteriota bacterium B35]